MDSVHYIGKGVAPAFSVIFIYLYFIQYVESFIRLSPPVSSHV